MIRHLSRLPLFAMLVLSASVAAPRTAPGTPVPQPRLPESLGIGAAPAISLKLRRGK